MQFFKTPPHPCSYIPGRMAETVFLDPAEPVSPELYDALNQAGFRRSGEHIYRPDCAGCQRCQSLRVRVGEFAPRRRHRRVLRRNGDVHWKAVPVRYDDAYWPLYQSYINARHADGDMYPPDSGDFYRFLFQEDRYGFLLEGYCGESLMLVAVIDRLASGLSAVYTFFDPHLADRSPGQLAILQQIHLCRELGLPYLYLGYWLESIPNMAYKAGFTPAEVFRNDTWQTLITD